MSTLILKEVDKQRVVNDLRSEFKPLDEVWDIDLLENGNIQLSARYYKLILKFKDTKQGFKSSVSMKWNSISYLFILASLPFFLVPWMFYTLFFANPKMNKAKRLVERTLKEKYSEVKHAS
nr:hypothetical protein HAGR004_37840 [Bdellovibrio sp. HAGR004]